MVEQKKNARGYRGKNIGRRTQICREHSVVSIVKRSTLAIQWRAEKCFELTRCISVIKIAAERCSAPIRSFYTFAGELWEMTAFRRIAYTRARIKIIVKYFVSTVGVIFHGKIQFYIVLFRFIPLLLAFRIKTFLPAGRCYFHTVITRGGEARAPIFYYYLSFIDKRSVRV